MKQYTAAQKMVTRNKSQPYSPAMNSRRYPPPGPERSGHPVHSDPAWACSLPQETDSFLSAPASLNVSIPQRNLTDKDRPQKDKDSCLRRTVPHALDGG